MTEYHTSIKKLEELVQTRIELIGDSSRQFGVDKSIDAKLAKLNHENSLPARAEDYCRRLKIVRQKLGGHAMRDMDLLIAKQENLLPEVRPNISKPRSPRILPTPPLLIRPQRRSNNLTNTAAPPHVTWANPAAAPASLQNFSAFQATAATPISGAWPAATPIPQRPPQATNALPHEAILLSQRPSLYIPILTITSKSNACRNSNMYQPLTIKIGGSNHESNYLGYTHWLLASPSRIGTIMHTTRSNLLVVQSVDYIQHVAGDKLHIEASSAQDAGRFVGYMRQWYGGTVAVGI